MKRCTYFFVLATLLVSCEYQLEETNYREIEPPSENVTMEINMNNIHPLDTIYVWGPTKLTCSLNAGQRNIHQADIRIDGGSVPMADLSQSSVSFYVYPDQIGYGKHQLKIDCITSSGTRSLADLMGFEGYEFETYWNIKVIKLSDYFTGGYRILEDGQVELFWNNSILPNAVITKCDLHNRFGESVFGYSEELNPLQKSVIVNDYVCGKSIYTIRTTFKLDDLGYSYPQYSSYDGDIFIDTPIPTVYIEDLDKNRLRLYWDKPIVGDAKYTVHYGRRYYYKDEISDITDTTIVVPKPAIGNQFEVSVDFYPKKPKYPWPSASSDTSFFYGKKVGFGWFLYNTTENIIYSVDNDSIAVIDPYSLDSRRVKSETYAQNYIVSPNSSKFAVIGYDKIVVYNDSKLLSPTILNIQQQINSSYTLSGEYLFEFNESASNIYDLTTGSKTNTQPPLGFWVKISADGRYFACYNKDISGAIDIYVYDNSNFTKITTHTSPHTLGSNDYHFHPKNPDQIIIEWNDPPNNRIVDLYRLPQFEKMRSTNLPWESRILNIDPITEHVAYYHESKVIIAPLSDLNNRLYTTPDFQCLFYNNCLFSHNGYAANIKKDLLQP